MTNIDASVSTTGKWLKHAHLQGLEHTVTIVDTTEELMKENDPSSKKIVLWFDGKPLGLGLNVTNKQALIDAYGKMTDSWINKQIVLYPTTCMFEGNPVYPCVRLRLAGQPAIASVEFGTPIAQPGPGGPPAGPVTEAEIPF